MIGQVENRFGDPRRRKGVRERELDAAGDAGDGLFSSEEDVDNPGLFTPVVKGWREAWAAHHPEWPRG